MLSQSSEILVTCACCGKEIQLEPQFCDYTCRRKAGRRSEADRLWDKVDRDGPIPTHRPELGCCWPWIAHLLPNGYGSMGSPTGLKGERRHASRYVHRIAWELASGQPIPAGLHIGHTCDNRACVRNDSEGTYEVRGVLLPRFGHLFLCTRTQNNNDMIDKGRKAPMPRDNPWRKIRPADALIIQQLSAAGWLQQAIADKFSIGQTTVSSILAGKRVYLK